MARRQRTLSSPDTVMGDSHSLVRIIEVVDDHSAKRTRVTWQCGFLDSGEWKSHILPMVKEYVDTDYDTLIATGEGSAGQHEAIQDQIFADLQTDGAIGAGTESDY